MRGVKVLGQSSMIRSSACPGLIVSTNHDAATAAFNARKNNEQKDQLLEEQGKKIQELQEQMQLLINAQSGTGGV